MNQVYVGIDQSYTGFGISLYDPDSGDHQTEVWEFTPAKSGASGVHQLNHVQHQLHMMVGPLSSLVRHIAMEGYANEAKFGREKAGELGGAVKLALLEGLPAPVCYPTIVAPGQLKKFATGSGKTPKDGMLLEVFKKWNVEFPDVKPLLRNNAADAYGLARLAHAIDHGAPYAYQLAVLQELKTKGRIHAEQPAKVTNPKRRF